VVATALIAFKRNRFLLNIAPFFGASIWNNNGGALTAQSVESGDELRKTMLRSMAYQAVGKSSGYHGALIQHQIDALSVISNEYYHSNRVQLNADGGASQVRHMFAVTRAIELFVRSMSNLIEIFHHATFNYIIISQTKFVTMAKYSIPIALIGVAPLLESFAVYKLCYRVFFQHLSLSIATLSMCVLFGAYSYAVIVCTNLLSSNIDLFYTLVVAVFLAVMGLTVLLKLWSACKPDARKHDFYLSFVTLLNLYSMFSQIWLPIALNFSCGLYMVTLCVLMLFVVKKKAVLPPPSSVMETGKENENEKETMKKKSQPDIDAKEILETETNVFVSYGLKSRLARMLVLLMVPIGAVYVIMLVMDMSLFSLMNNLKFDLLNEDIYHQHPAWIVLFLTVLPTYLGCWVLLFFT